MEDQIFFIHPTAIVEPGATIENGVEIWHFSHVMQAAKIGKDCVLGQNVFIGEGVIVGSRVKIQNNVSIYKGVTLEDDVFIGPSAVFTNVINPRSFINRKSEFKNTIIRKGATIGANATILCGIEVGAYAMVGAGTVVVKSVLPFEMIVGNPARQLGWVSRNGYVLKFDDSGRAFCQEEGGFYRLKNGFVEVENQQDSDVPIPSNSV